jgi:hypothetical protein
VTSNPYQPPQAPLDESGDISSRRFDSTLLVWNVGAAWIVFGIMWYATQWEHQLSEQIPHNSPWMTVGVWIYFGLIFGIGLICGVWAKRLAIGGGIGLLAAVNVYTFVIVQSKFTLLILPLSVFFLGVFLSGCFVTSGGFSKLRARY